MRGMEPEMSFSEGGQGDQCVWDPEMLSAPCSGAAIALGASSLYGLRGKPVQQ